MTMTPSQLGMYMGTVPATPYLRMGSTPNSTSLGTQPPRRPSPGDDSNSPITNHGIALPWDDREERSILSGQQLFIARVGTLNKNSRALNMVTLPKLNQILRDGRQLYHDVVEAPSPNTATSGGVGTRALQMRDIDNIRIATGTAGRSMNPNKRLGRPPTAYFINPHEGFATDRYRALRAHEKTMAEYGELGFVPDERTIWNFDMADVNSENLPDATFREAESERLRKQLEKYSATVSPELRRNLTQMLDEISVRDEAATAIVTEYSRNKAADLRYVTREGIENFWNYMGTVVSTLFGQTNAIASTAAAALVNYGVHGPVEATNIWGNGLRALEDHLYLILRARRDPTDPETPGSIRDGQPFEIVPYVARRRQEPTFGALAYYDLAGRKRYGRAWFVGRVRYDVKQTRPENKRRLAWGEGNYNSAVEATQTLDKIDIVQKVA